ncbi:MAG: hypothetical protein ABEJ03_05635 [Candidatus Nanohaloarchaea archaeon]
MVSSEQAEVVLLIAVGSALLLGLWTWSSTSVDTISKSSGSEKNRTLRCADIEIDYVNVKTVEDSKTITFQSSKDLESIAFYSTGDPGRNVTVENVSARDLQEVSTPFRGEGEIFARIPGCRRTFR